ncbi:GNAT family N-acetyltransferase [Sutcliffiella cohnii]|uniref:Spermidine acetyltransferase n=1 Tax=Sutcliffiella cohnii TaxID=33932 RepID=A0A223KYA9_9BACI|nr:GNAT family N-acetyltransferase [Sutcliffiella cohnii]AST94367.1 spermidine acetyltransferase [Sutcliffiella cohnii]MED4019214.1 GNAT family N-acetyltransferase [Sutcliffiella cohnii]
MEKLTLKSIDKYNWETAIELSVNEDQKRFIATNLYSIAQVQFLDNFYVKGVYNSETMIGFTMYGIDEDDQNYWIYRLMIDKNYQGNGYGLKAIKLVIEEIKRENNDRPFILIGYHPNNGAARKVYKKAGFIETSIAPWGEQLAKFNL